jgi:hypothetical protein
MILDPSYYEGIYYDSGYVRINFMVESIQCELVLQLNDVLVGIISSRVKYFSG